MPEDGRTQPRTGHAFAFDAALRDGARKGGLSMAGEDSGALEPDDTAADAAAAIVITDTFDPRLTDLTVTLNGTALTAPTQYTYDAATGVFATAAGVVTVPAALHSGRRHRRVQHHPRHGGADRHRHGVSKKISPGLRPGDMYYSSASWLSNTSWMLP